MESTRLFVGNLPADTKEDCLKDKFSPYGQILKVELKERKFLHPPSCFAFVTIGASKNGLQKCIYDLSDGYAWNGHTVTVDFAKESFLSRLEKERLDPKNKNIIIEDKVPNFETKSKLFEGRNSHDGKGTINKEISKVSSKNESEDSETSESDSDDNTTNLYAVNKSQYGNSNIQQNSKVLSKQETDSSDSDSKDKESNLNKIVNQTNDVMKQFEQFSSVWQSSEEDEDDNNSDSSEEIFEAFKSKPNTETANEDAKLASSSKSISSFPEHNRSGDFVKFVKTRQPQVQSKKEADIFSEVKVSTFPKVETRNKVSSGFPETKKTSFSKIDSKEQNTNGFPKFQSKNKKITFDTEANSEIRSTAINEGSKFPRSTQFQNNETNTLSNVKPAKPQAKNHVDAENKRRNAMEERIKEISDKRKAIKQALANVDGPQSSVNKKIFFSQDSDDEDQSQTKPTHHPDLNAKQQLNLVQTTSRADGRDPNRNRSDTVETGGGKKDRKSLFDDGSKSEDEDSEEEFKIKKQFEGEKGLKLLELQASYNNDTRFNLDDRFAEDEVEDRAMEVVEEQSEKEKQMLILENVLGYKVKQHQTKNGLLSVPRFDPLNPDSKSLLQVKVKGDASAPKRKRRQRDLPAEVSGETFYQLDEAYFTSSKEKKAELDEPFSLLKMLNRDTNSDNDTHSENFPNPIKSKLPHSGDEYRTEPLGKSSNPFASVGARFEYDSSDTEDEEEDREKRKEEGQVGTGQERAGQFGTGLAPPPSLSEKMFFLDKDDDRFKEAQEFWQRKPCTFPLSGGDSFKVKRRELALKLKTKIRRNLKNSNPGPHHLRRRKKTTKMMKTQRRRS